MRIVEDVVGALYKDVEAVETALANGRTGAWEESARRYCTTRSTWSRYSW